MIGNRAANIASLLLDPAAAGTRRDCRTSPGREPSSNRELLILAELASQNPDGFARLVSFADRRDDEQP
jgi:hypothetical protein